MLARARYLLLPLLLWGCPPQKPDPKAQADGLYLAGTSEFLQGNFAKAHEFFDQVRALRPDDPRLPAAVGEVFLAEGKLAQALEAFEAAAQLDPKRSTNWSRLGLIHSLKGNRAEAESALRKALALNPKDLVALEELAELKLREKNLDEALRHLRLASEACPEPERPRLLLKMSSELVKANRSAEALDTLEKGAAAGARPPELLSEWGDLLVAAGRLQEAVKVYREAATLSAYDPTLWELVGELHLRLDRPADAEAAFRESLRVKDRAVVHVALARLYLQRHDANGAQEELDKALASASGEEVRETLDLADLLASMGRAKDGLLLLDGLSEEEEFKGDRAFHLRMAQMAKKAGDLPAQKQACARARVVDPALARCP